VRTAEQVKTALRTHVSAFFDRHRVDELELDDLPFDPIPLRRSLPNTSILRVAPGPKFGLWVYITSGAWSATRDERDEHGLSEFVLSAEHDDALHLETLCMTTSYHADPKHRLGPGHTVPIGRPWIDGADADHLLISLPYPWGRDLEVCALGDDHIHLFWLLPITKAERDFKADCGLEALEEKFDAAAIEWWKPERQSVV
jgi:hypothetical protein